ncbi:hypothetical protein N7456_010117 [Penicillium angulare]|uniref:Alpha/beta hydrolase fold-3 domain-containing protein n=1 Tax=Penicillium angulare TaxID=116970 RepID=A0A9W9F670_9EURO|nr:hypothetical protein N7456_010117 [Penicillium angulare]
METKTFTYKVVEEDNQLLADLHWQKDSRTTVDGYGHPIVLILHGGGLVVGSKDTIPKPQISYLTRAGFLVVVPNYRLCPQVSAFEGPITDSKDCLIWAISNASSLLSQEAAADGYQVNTEKVVVMGHSGGGGLALNIPNQSDLPVQISAVLDFYGAKYLDDPSYSQPHPWFTSREESWDEEYINRVFDGPEVSAADLYLGTELPPPRDAWLTSQFKRGKWLSEVVRDGNVGRVDGAKGFSKTYPPTMFIHGLSDTFDPCAVSERAHAELQGLGVDTELLLVPGKDHMFDLMLQEENQEFLDFVVPGLKFLSEKVGLQVL